MKSTEKRGNLLAGGFLPSFSINCFFLFANKVSRIFPKKQRRKLEYLTLLSLFFVRNFPSLRPQKTKNKADNFSNLNLSIIIHILRFSYQNVFSSSCKETSNFKKYFQSRFEGCEIKNLCLHFFASDLAREFQVINYWKYFLYLWLQNFPSKIAFFSCYHR